MNALCFNTMDRSAYLLGDQDPNLPAQIRAAARAGFPWIGPDAYSIQRFCEEGGRLEALTDQLEAAQIGVFELPTLLVSRDVKGTRDEIQRLAGYASALRPQFIQLNVDHEIDESVLDGLRRAGDTFGPIGARLAIEYLPWLPAIRDLRSTRDLLDRARVEGAGVLVDTWHFTHSADTWEDLDDLPLSELAYVQFDDHPALASDDLVEETLQRRVMPGQGTFELERFCARIRAKGYTGPVSCEVLSAVTREADIDVVTRQVFQTSTPFWT